MKNKLLLLSIPAIVSAGLQQASAQAADPVLASGRPTSYSAADPVYSQVTTGGAASGNSIMSYTPSGLAGGFATTNLGGPPALNNNGRFNYDAGLNAFTILGDYVSNSTQPFDPTRVDGRGNTTNVSRLLGYRQQFSTTDPTDKASCSLTLGDSRINLSTGPGLDAGTAFRDYVIGATNDAQAGWRYILNGNNVHVNKVSGGDGVAGAANYSPNLYIFFNHCNLEVSGQLNMQSGRLMMGKGDAMNAPDSVVLREPYSTTFGGGTYNISSGGTFTAGGSLSSYVDGWMINYNYTTLSQTFPLGDHSIYAPLTISATANPANGYNAFQYLADTTTPALAAHGPAITSISAYEHYRVYSNHLAAGTTITIPYNPANRAAYIYDPSQLVLVGYNGSTWVPMGSGSISGGNLVTTLSVDLTNITHIAIGSISPSNPLPVDFMTFNAAKNAAGTQSQLAWTVANNAKDVATFTIERSLDAKTFTAIGQVTVTGTEKGNFTAVDATPAQGTNYYRIRATEHSGAQLSTKVLSLVYNAAAQHIVLAPNPAQQHTTIYFKGGDDLGAVICRVYDAAGRVVIEQQAQATAGSSIQLATAALAPGTYVVEVVSALSPATGRLYTTRMVKQ